jgi:hypothetical integral membrane protein (TIGR02206 family)
MEYFWHITGDIPKGLGFAHFDTTHLCWLGVLLVFAVSMCILYRRLGQRGRRIFRYVLASLIVCNELFKDACLLIGDRYNMNYLPLHLCSINIVLIAIHAIKPFKALDQFLYTICIPTALLALLLPTWTKLPVLNFSHLHSFTVHIMLFTYPLALTVGGDIRPRLRELWKCLVLLVSLAVPIYFFNLHFETNYMFLRKTDGIAPLVLFEDLFGSHLVAFPVIAVVIFAVMYLPLEIYHFVRRKKATSVQS